MPRLFVYPGAEEGGLFGGVENFWHGQREWTWAPRPRSTRTLAATQASRLLLWGFRFDDRHPEQVAIHYGRSRIFDVIERFMNAIGSPVILNHRALCSLNKRAANYASIGDTDWETVDAEHTKYILNFGSNFYEAHQGHVHFLKRVIRGRFDNGAKLVTFDVRLSNTAGRSDEWYAPFPGTEGAIALAMAHTMMEAGEYDPCLDGATARHQDR